MFLLLSQYKNAGLVPFMCAKLASVWVTVECASRRPTNQICDKLRRHCGCRALAPYVDRASPVLSCASSMTTTGAQY